MYYLDRPRTLRPPGDIVRSFLEQTPPPMALVPAAGDGFVPVRAPLDVVFLDAWPSDDRILLKAVRPVVANQGVAQSESPRRRGRRAFVIAQAVANLFTTRKISSILSVPSPSIIDRLTQLPFSFRLRSSSKSFPFSRSTRPSSRPC